MSVVVTLYIVTSTHSMNEETLLRFQEFVKSHFLIVVMSSLGFLFLILGLVLVLPQGKEESITFEETSEKNTLQENNSESTITVDVSGAVLHPGVYTLSSDSRMKDAIQAAGGMTEEADAEQISKSINLAQKLTDSSKVYIPFEGETVSGSLPAGSVAGASSTSLININTASVAELDRLPRIGAVTAQKIISNRPYQSLNDLVTKKAVSSSVFSEIQKLISL